MKPIANDDRPWVRVCKNAPYFELENNESWTPIGQNDAITWPDFQGLFRRNDPGNVEGHMAFLAEHGVTCIRMMMEYCQTEHRYLENPVGRFQPNMVQFWDDMFRLCEKYNIRLLLTPFDTFWMARRWKFHPYNARSGGPCKSKSQWLTSPGMMAATKNRFTFFIERWGGSGALFAWDLWNEIDPAYSQKDVSHLSHYIAQISDHIRQLEMRLFEKSHPQTVSVFAPLLDKHDMHDLIFRHPALDFASTHFYHKQSIDYPKNAHAAALTTGEMVREALLAVPEGRPFLDSEHGPIAYFKKRRHGLPEVFDDQYFLNMQWAHLASGAAGGGMRWPYRHPHTLTHGMRKAQLNMAGFSDLIDWQNFKRKNISATVYIQESNVRAFACGDQNQAVLWLMRMEKQQKSSKNAKARQVRLTVPGLGTGDYRIHFWDTVTGKSTIQEKSIENSDLEFEFDFTASNIAIAIRRQ